MHNIRIEYGRDVYVDDEFVARVSRHQAQLLELLLRTKGVVTIETFLNNIYGGRDEPDPKIFSVLICNLRRIFKRAGINDLIETFWGRGYKINPKYQLATGAVAMMQVELPLEYVDTIAFMMSMSGEEAVKAIVKREYKRLQEA